MHSQDSSFFAVLLKDGRPLLTWTALALLFSGGFALFLSANGQLLPHDMAFLGVPVEELRLIAAGRVVSFMFHDRVAVKEQSRGKQLPWESSSLEGDFYFVPGGVK